MNVWILMSGGLDSTVCAHYFLERQNDVTGVFVDYGQMAREPEYEAVQAVTEHLNIPLKTIGFVSPRRYGSGEVIGRNAFLIFALLMAESPKQGIISLGIHGGTAYYDCGREFVGQVGRIIESYSGGSVVLNCPFLNRDKSFIYDYGSSMGVPIALTYSCEEGTVPPCGSCLSCKDRYALSTR